MTEDLNTAFTIFFIGMITVFVVLSMVVLTGKVLIYISNTYFSTNIKKSSPTPVSIHTDIVPSSIIKSTIAPAKLAAIVVAVEIATQGKGKINHIEKMENS